MKETKMKNDHSKQIDHDMGSLDCQRQARNDDQAVMGAFAHQIALVTWFVGPMAIYLISGDSFVKKHASESFSWQINISFGILLSLILTPVSISILMIGLITVLNVVMCVIGSIKAVNENYWNYPISTNYLH